MSLAFSRVRSWVVPPLHDARRSVDLRVCDLAFVWRECAAVKIGEQIFLLGDDLPGAVWHPAQQKAAARLDFGGDVELHA